jgi:hypothetical protein
MNAANEQFEGDADERQVEQLIQSALAAPPMSADFVNRLSLELDHEFALTTYYADNKLNGSTVNGTNGAAFVNGHVSTESLSVEEATVPFEAPAKRSPWRMVATVAAAAALLVAVGLWNTDSAYGWAAMLEALEKSEWVQAITRGGNAEGGATAAIGWFSKSQQVAAREAGESRVYLNFNKRTAENFDPAERVIRKAELAEATAPSSEALLIMLLDGETASTSADLELVDESLQPTDNDNEAELTVTLRKKSQPNDLLRLAFVVNTQTNLPISGRVLDGGQMIAKSIEFSYPKQGPDSIFALGVPAAVPVVVEKSAVENSIEEPIGEALAGVERSGPSVVVEELVVAGGPGSPPAQPATDRVSEATTEQPKDDAPAQVDGERIASAPVATKTADFEVPSIDANAKPLGDRELVEKLNSLLAEFWKNQGITPAEPASDTEFLRRVYLDLTGRIPTVSEIYAFQGDADPNRR